MRTRWYLLAIAVHFGCEVGHVLGEKETPSPAQGCSDLDGDGYGIGRECEGPDCNDFVPGIHATEACEGWCAEHGDAPGCPCEGREPTICYLGPAETMGVGACRTGMMTCTDGSWGACSGQVVPADEGCNEVDDDCDGTVDDGVGNACGNCDPVCEALTLGDDAHPWEIGEAPTHLVDTGDSLTLGKSDGRPYLWVPNTHGGATISKINTETRLEEGRYRLDPPSPPGSNVTTPMGGISVSPEGDVVLGYNFGLARLNAEDCPPGETSTGPHDLRDLGDDACLIWTSGLPGNSLPAPVAWEVRSVLDGVSERYVWAALARVFDYPVVELTEDGVLTGREVSLPHAVASVAIAPDGHLWTVPAGHGPRILREIDLAGAEIVEEHPGLPEEPNKYLCSAFDLEGRLWVSAIPNQGAVYDPESRTGTALPFGEPTFGVAVDWDGRVWFGRAGADGTLWRVDGDTFALEGVGTGTIEQRAYPAVDADDNVWIIDRARTTAEVFPSDDWDAHESAVEDLVEPGSACGDMTGTSLARVHGVGLYRHVFEGCYDAQTTWTSLAYRAATPNESSLTFALRTAENAAALTNAPWVTVGVAPDDTSPLDVVGALARAGLTSEHVLELSVTFRRGDDRSAPALFEVALWRTCSQPDPR